MSRSHEETLTNWGRWGADDELGTLNLIDDQARARGAAQVRSGRTVSLARTTTATPLVSGPFAPLDAPSSPVQSAMMFTGSPPRAMAELVTFTTHHPRLTHLDALSHFVVDGQVYPGRPVAETVTPLGVRFGSTSSFVGGLVMRGVLLDLAPGGQLAAGTGVSAADLDRAAERAQVTMEPGDALVLRGGWDLARRDAPVPGVTVDAVAWMHAHDVALYAGDIGDAFPPLDLRTPAPLHGIGLARLGMPLIDSADLEELAAVRGEEGRSTFLLVVAPPRVPGLTGAPVNPLAIF